MLVIDGGGATNNAVVGDLMMTYIIQRGCVGVVVDGAVRDAQAFLDADFPCYARATSHRGPYKSGPGVLNVPVAIAGQVVNPGDIVVGDEDGLVTFPQSDAGRLLEAARRSAEKEQEIRAEILTGRVEAEWLEPFLEKASVRRRHATPTCHAPGFRQAVPMAAKSHVDALRAAGRTIIDFTIGEPDFPTPRNRRCRCGGIELGADPLYRLGRHPVIAEGDRSEARQRERVAYSPEQIVVGTGAKHVIYNALAATLNEADEVIVPAPYWVSYPDMVALHGGTPVVVTSDERTSFKLMPQALERAITSRTRWPT